MDPNTALTELLDAIEDKDAWRIIDALDALRSWIDGGGFIPALPEHVRECIAGAP